MSRMFALFVLVLGLAAPLLSAEPRKFAEPLQVTKEMEAILKEFPDAESKAARNEALAQLAAAAESARSTEYSALKELYLALNRRIDANRMQGLIIKEATKARETNPANTPPSERPGRPKLPTRPAPRIPPGTPNKPPPDNPEPAPQPGEFDLSAELRKVNERFNFFKAFPRGTRREGSEYEKFMADRKAALVKLAEAAEAAKCTDHVALANLYGDLERYADAAREVQAQFAQRPNDLNGYSPLLTYLCKARRTDDALAAFRQWLAVEVPLSDVMTYLAPLESDRPSPVRLLVITLLFEGRPDDAEQVCSEMRARIGKLLAQYDQGPVPEGLRRPTIINANATVSSLSGTGMDFDVQRFSRSDLRIQLDDIFAKFRPTAGKGPSSQPDPEAENRKAALSALAAVPGTAQTTDLPTLLKLYALLNRTDEALAVHRRWLDQEVKLADVPGFVRHLGLIGEVRDLHQSLIRQGKFAEGWQMLADLGLKLDEFLAQFDQGPAPKHFSRPLITNAILDIVSLQKDLAIAEVSSLVAAGKPAEAEQTLDRWKSSLSKWKATFTNPQSEFYLYLRQIDERRAAIKK